MATPLFETSIKSLPLLARGKVRDIYAVDDATLLIVTSDRLSAFDVVLPDPIPDKGRVLIALANFWFDKLGHILPNQLTGIDPETVVAADERGQVRGRALVVKRLTPLPIEAVVRGYVIGGGWKDYQATGAICGITLPAGLRQAAKLPAPIFTPSSKADMGEHDENISFARAVELVGAERAAELRDASLEIYRRAAAVAEAHGLILADTKFEFGVDAAGALTLADEVLTSDSSRYWDAAAWASGTTPAERMASFDKQIVRDWLAANWDGAGTPPELPAEIVDRTAAKYRELLEKLTRDETATAG